MISACACMGPAYGEPYCYCSMKSRGLEYVMKANPIRIAEEKRSAEEWKLLWEPGGWFHDNLKKVREDNESKS